MKPIPYLTFPGTCMAAMTYYAEIFDGTIELTMKASDMPDFPVPDDKKDWMAHMTLKIGDGELLASDALMGDAAPMAGCSVLIDLPTAAQGRAVFERMAQDGAVQMPYQATFWSPGFGQLTDKFGIHWMISTDEEISS